MGNPPTALNLRHVGISDRHLYTVKKMEREAILLLLLSHFSRVQLCATPWTAAYQAPPSMGFSRQEYWSGVPLPSPREAIGCEKMFAKHVKDLNLKYTNNS